MEVLRDGVLAFLAAVGITTLVWMIAGLFERRMKLPEGAALLLAMRDGEENVESAVYELAALRKRAETDLPILLVDCGLTREQRRRAELLANRKKRVWIGSLEELQKRLQ